MAEAGDDLVLDDIDGTRTAFLARRSTKAEVTEALARATEAFKACAVSVAGKVAYEPRARFAFRAPSAGRAHGAADTSVFARISAPAVFAAHTDTFVADASSIAHLRVGDGTWRFAR